MIDISRNNAKKVEGHWGTIEKAVEYLTDCRNKGESVCIEFNGKILYSADVTLEKAYLQITGLTPEEMNNVKEELREAETEEQRDEIRKRYDAIKQDHIEEAKKNAKKVEGHWGTIEKAVEYLTDCRNKGESVCIEFNGKILYSADVTLEKAYLQITGLTPEEMNNVKEELRAAETEEQRDEIRKKYDAIKARHIKEEDIIKNKGEKIKLESKINEIEEQLKGLKTKKAQLEESQTNELEEK